MPKTKKHRKNPQTRARPSGWFTSDADEIERRRLRGVNEAIRIESQTRDDVFFGVYQTPCSQNTHAASPSGAGQQYASAMADRRTEGRHIQTKAGGLAPITRLLSVWNEVCIGTQC